MTAVMPPPAERPVTNIRRGWVGARFMGLRYGDPETHSPVWGSHPEGVGGPGKGPPAGKQLGINRHHDRRHATARREAGNEYPTGINSVIEPYLVDHLLD